MMSLDTDGSLLPRDMFITNESTLNELCSRCSTVDFEILFEDCKLAAQDFQVSRQCIGTLYEVVMSRGCGFCELVSFAVSSSSDCDGISQLKKSSRQEVSCYIQTRRTNFMSPFASTEAQKLTGISILVSLEASDDFPSEDDEIKEKIDNQEFIGNQIRLLHSDLRAAARPLLNGAVASYPRANLSLVKEWISLCQQLHRGTCWSADDPFNDLDQRYHQSFKVIDVERRVVVHVDPQHTEYVALSYVWGYSQERYLEVQRDILASGYLGDARLLPARLPNTIEDAILFCKRMAFRYLWVDLFCVDQTGSEEQRVQLRHMGHTYRLAHLTVVAAVGESSDAGLPGIRDYTLSTFAGQLVRRVQNIDLVTGLTEQLDLLDDCFWRGRSWTYQEGALSTRCLIFGGGDPIFVCRQGSCRESLQATSLAYEARSGQGLNLSAQRYPQLCVPLYTRTRQQGWSFQEYAEIITFYNNRALTRCSDVLNALEGYLALITQMTGAEFVYGLPKGNLIDGLCWSTDSIGLQRQEGFPSWSWAGWSPVECIWPYQNIELYINEDSKLAGASRTEWVSLTSFEHASLAMGRETLKVLQHSADVSICPRHEQKRLLIRSQVKEFNIYVRHVEMLGYSFMKSDGTWMCTESFFSLSDAPSFRISTSVSDETKRWLQEVPRKFIMLRRWEDARRTPSGHRKLFNCVLALLLDTRGEGPVQRLGIASIPNEVWDCDGDPPRLESIELE